MSLISPTKISGTREFEFCFDWTARMQTTTTENDHCETRASTGSHVYPWLVNAGTFGYACWYS